MKTPPKLKSARLKLCRAIEHLDALELEIKRFNESKPYKVMVERNFNIGQNMLVYYPLGTIPAYWSTVIGDILFNLRSALDHAVYELTVWHKGAPLPNTEFPIFEDKTVFSEVKNNGQPTNRSGLYKMRGLSKKTQAVIEARQPCNIGESGLIPYLSVLHELNIVDKHREVHLCRQSFGGVSFPSLAEISPNAGSGYRIALGIANLEERTILAYWVTDVFDGEMEVDTDVTIGIAFDKRSIPRFNAPAPVIGILHDLTIEVGEGLNSLENSVK